MAEREYRIHPAIGIARVGNAARSDQDTGFYFIGPEHPGVAANSAPGSTFKKDGRIKPQAARFRIFEYEKGADGKFHPIGEISTRDAGRNVKIVWSVHLANRKANFCEFLGQDGADDPGGFYSKRTKDNVRNAKKVKGLAKRQKLLELDGKKQDIEGGAVAKSVHFPIDHLLADGSKKLEIRTLGELRTDSDGRLVVIGGMGQTDFDPQVAGGAKEGSLTNFANNDGWFDDVSDGPVTATLTIDGAGAKVAAGWVIVGPPDFAPAVPSYRTMYDTLVDVIVREMTIPANDGLFAGPLNYIADMNADWKKNKTIKDFKPDFDRDIAPFLEANFRLLRVHMYQFLDGKTGQVIRGGQRTPYHIRFLDFAILGDPNAPEENRLDIFDRLRNPASLDNANGKIDPSEMPSAFGDRNNDADNNNKPTHPAYFHSLSKLQYALLYAWAKGDFVAGTGKAAAVDPTAPPTPEGLDRAALESMSGGAFYPGMEASWLFARKEAWERPFRLAHGRQVGTVPVPGRTTRPLLVEAGAFSQQMALPWQADFRACEAGDTSDTSLGTDGMRRIAWWPANRPDDVFPESTPTTRMPWARDSSGTSFPTADKQYYEKMVDDWWTLGFVVEMTPPGAPKDLYEVEFNAVTPAPPTPPLVAEAPAGGGGKGTA
jgi:hypothetical protein